MRIALLINLAPRKLGSLEQWLVAMAVEAKQRGHQLDIFGRRPIHEDIESLLRSIGTNFSTTDELEAAPVAAVRKLSSYDLIHVNMFQPRTTPALLAYAAWPAKVILVDHTSGNVLTELLSASVKGAISKSLDKVSLARVDGLVGVSEYVRLRDIKRFGMDPDRVKTIYNGVDERLYRPGPRTPGPIRMAAVAHLTHEKGLDVLLKAVAQMQHPVTLKIAGDGPLDGKFKALATQLGINDRVKFLGLRNDVATIVGEADIFIHPARWQEAFGLTIAEAMASGCAVVASNVGGIPEIIEHGTSGMLVPPDDAKTLATTLDALAQSPELRQRLGVGGRARVMERFTIEQCVNSHVDYIEEVAFDTRRVRKAAQPVPGATRNVAISDDAGGQPQNAPLSTMAVFRDANRKARGDETLN